MENEENHTQTYLSFNVGNETYAMHTKYVVSILALKPITKLPVAPEHIRGIINFRGFALPIIDLRSILKLNNIENATETSIISTEFDYEDSIFKIGLLVDTLVGVFNIASNDILPAPKVNKNLKSSWITGLVRNEETFTQILNIDTLLNEFDQNSISDLVKSVDAALIDTEDE